MTYVGTCTPNICGAICCRYGDGMCEHLTPDLRCSIYDTRPEDCRTFPRNSRDKEWAKGCTLEIVDEKE